MLDGDNREIPDHELETDGLAIMQWKRYEIENYLLVPEAIRRFLCPDPQDLFLSHAANKAFEYLHQQLPETVFSNPLSDEAEAVMEVPASKKMLPQMFERAGRQMEKNDYYLIAEKMNKNEIHQDAIEMLDAIARLFPSPSEGEQ